MPNCHTVYQNVNNLTQLRRQILKIHKISDHAFRTGHYIVYEQVARLTTYIVYEQVANNLYYSVTYLSLLCSYSINLHFGLPGYQVSFSKLAEQHMLQCMSKTTLQIKEFQVLIVRNDNS